MVLKVHSARGTLRGGCCSYCTRKTLTLLLLLLLISAKICDADVGQVWNTHNWTCHKEVLGHGDEIWALAVIGDRLISGSIDRQV